MKTFNSSICRILSATCSSALCLIALSTQAATITVSNTNDGGAGSLRQALANAVNGDTIAFNSSLNGQTIALTTGELLVDKNVIINGPGANNLRVDANHVSRVFHITLGVSATIAGLTITNGDASEAAFPAGGGIYNDHSTLTVNDCSLSGNSAQWGGGIENESINGSAMLRVNNSTLRDNSAVGVGGGIYNDGSRGSATLEIVNSTLSGNSTSWGGGIYNDHATSTVSNCTISGNSASYFGGGIFNTGIHGSATLRVTNSTLSGNSASLGAGIYSYGDSSTMLAVLDSTLNANGIFNALATSQLGSTIFNASEITNDSGTINSLGYNLSSEGDGGFLTGTSDQLNTDPMLGPLQDNGGPTFTHELLPGSPAFEAGDPNFTPPPDYDQRGLGFPRVVNGRIDIGAFESHLTPTPTPTATATATATATSTPTATATATATPTATATATSTPTPIPTPTPTPTAAYTAQVQQPINPDGSSVFNVRRGVVPVKFALTLNGVLTCNLPPATIAVHRTSTGGNQEIDESVYSGPADSGSNFRIDGCQYVYNLSASALGVGTYRVDVIINGQVVGSATFQLR